jgi:Tfp pilus assembly protein PilN
VLPQDINLWSTIIGGVVVAGFVGIAKGVAIIMDNHARHETKERITTLAEFKILLDERKKEVDVLKGMVDILRSDHVKVLDVLKEEHRNCSARLDRAFMRIEQLKHALVNAGIPIPAEWIPPDTLVPVMPEAIP